MKRSCGSPSVIGRKVHKSEVRNPKSERIPKSEIRKAAASQTACFGESTATGEVRISRFGFLSDFGFRVSDLSGHQKLVFTEALPTIFHRRVTVVGSTGHWPVPFGDSPNGTGGTLSQYPGPFLCREPHCVPPGQWPGGTGGSPVLPLRL